MARSWTLQYRISLSNVDRGLDRVQQVLVERHPSETAEHLTLRVLGWCLFWDERLRFGPGLSARKAPDLWAHDLTGRAVIWVECGAASADEVCKLLLHNRDVAVHLLFHERAQMQELVEGLAELRRPPTGLERLAVWTVDESFVADLARRESDRQRWSVTIVGDHVYVDADGTTVETELRRLPVHAIFER